MKETLISFCIVNLNAKSHLVSCLKSISMSTKCAFFEIIVVDNNSNDGSIEFLRHQYPEVKLIINKNKAKDLGISTEQIGKTLEILYGGKTVTTFNKLGREYPIILQPVSYTHLTLPTTPYV